MLSSACKSTCGVFWVFYPISENHISKFLDLTFGSMDKLCFKNEGSVCLLHFINRKGIKQKPRNMIFVKAMDLLYLLLLKAQHQHPPPNKQHFGALR